MDVMGTEGYQHLMEGRQEGREIAALHSSRTHPFDISFLDLLRWTDLKVSQNIYV